MTETEWFTSTDLCAMLDQVKDKASDRKLRLFGCAQYRRLWHLFDDEVRCLIVLAERFADGEVSRKRARKTWEQAKANWQDTRCVCKILENRVSLSLLMTDHLTWFEKWHAGYGQGTQVEAAKKRAEASILRDIVGNPFHSATAARQRLTATVLDLARPIYDDRAFDRLPILADALEDAGCTDADILNHCRQTGEHCRGCWVVDLVLGKE